MSVRKKRGASAPEPARDNPRAISPEPERASSPEAKSYPSAWQALSSEACRALVDAAVRVAAGAGIVALGSQLAGCAEPTCTSSRFEELRVHGESAYDSVVHYGDFQMATAELGYATGVVDHPPFHTGMMAGAMIMPAPTLPAPPTTTADPLALPDDDLALVGEEITDETE